LEIILNKNDKEVTFVAGTRISEQTEVDEEVCQINNLPPLPVSIGDTGHSQPITLQRALSIPLNNTNGDNFSDSNNLEEMFFKAARTGDKLKMEKLLLNDTIIGNIDKEHETEEYSALIWAAKNGHTDIIKLLIEKKANVNKIGGWNKSTALMKACDRGLVDIVDLFINAGAELNIQNSSGMTALMLGANVIYLIYILVFF
jgi:hypothetical protein